jgi:hypothetical protein
MRQEVEHFRGRVTEKDPEWPKVIKNRAMQRSVGKDQARQAETAA